MCPCCLATRGSSGEYPLPRYADPLGAVKIPGRTPSPAHCLLDQSGTKRIQVRVVEFLEGLLLSMQLVIAGTSPEHCRIVARSHEKYNPLVAKQHGHICRTSVSSGNILPGKVSVPPTTSSGPPIPPPARCRAHEAANSPGTAGRRRIGAQQIDASLIGQRHSASDHHARAILREDRQQGRSDEGRLRNNRLSILTNLLPDGQGLAYQDREYGTELLPRLGSIAAGPRHGIFR